MGSCSAATGLLAGGAIGALLGFLPALFTMGLSIPMGVTIGAGAGACAGAASGGIVGAAGAGLAGHGVYSHRDEIAHAATTAAQTMVSYKESAHTSMQRVRVKAGEFGSHVRSAAVEPQFQVTVAAAATGAAVGGAGGATVGFVGGGAVGAAAGVIPAFFTMGLSIPLGAAIGSGAGACMGSFLGAASGLVGGGTAGYGAYSKRSQIRSFAADAGAVAAGWADRMQTEAVKSREFVKVKAATGATYMRRCLAGGTGGTD